MPKPLAHDKKVKVLDTAEHTVWYEEVYNDPVFGRMTIGHCEVKVPWTKMEKAYLKSDFDCLLCLHGGPIFILADNPKLAKFAELMGFENTFQEAKTADGRSAEWWQLENKKANGLINGR